MFGRILAPLDRSEAAERAFPALVELARAFDSEIHMVGVCEPGTLAEETAYQQYLDRKAAGLTRGLTGSKATIRTAVIPGKSAEQILDYAREGDFDLVIMSAHGPSGIVNWSIGRTVERVVRCIRVPLLVVRPALPADGHSVFSRIAVPLDGSTRSAAVLPAIEHLAEKLPCHVILVQVAETRMHVRTIGGLDQVKFGQADIEMSRASASQYLQEVAASMAIDQTRVTYEVRVGEAAREIHALAEQKECTLIAMCSYHESPMEAWVMGRVATEVLRRCPQSVWLVPSFPDSTRSHADSPAA